MDKYLKIILVFVVFGFAITLTALGLAIWALLRTEDDDSADTAKLAALDARAFSIPFFDENHQLASSGLTVTEDPLHKGLVIDEMQVAGVTLPAQDGSAGQALLTDGEGTLYWSTQVGPTGPVGPEGIHHD